MKSLLNLIINQMYELSIVFNDIRKYERTKTLHRDD